MAQFITNSFLKRIAKGGRTIDGLRALESMSKEDRDAVPSIPKISSWECVLEEVVDTDHEPEYYARFAKALLERGYTRADIDEMRLIAWETAGWFNFEMMAWDWCHLSESDMILGLDNRLESGNITNAYSDGLRAKIDKYRSAPNKLASSSQNSLRVD